MSKIGRNDPCPCGSGLKYKKCCLNKEYNVFLSWEKNAEQILDNEAYKEKIILAYFCLLKYIDKKAWQGACHASSAVAFVLYSEFGLYPELYLGEAKCNDFVFDHSWVEINKEIYDVAIYLGLNGVEIASPVLKGVDIKTNKPTEIRYGVKFRGIDGIGRKILKTPLVEYMDNYPASKNGLWDIVVEIGDQIGLEVDIKSLRDKYKSIMWKLKTVE